MSTRQSNTGKASLAPREGLYSSATGQQFLSEVMDVGSILQFNHASSACCASQQLSVPEVSHVGLANLEANLRVIYGWLLSESECFWRLTE